MPKYNPKPKNPVAHAVKDATEITLAIERAKPTKKAATKTKPGKIGSNTSSPEIVYEQIEVKLFKDEPLYVTQAKEFLGWEEEPAGTDWGNAYLFKDRYGKKVRCLFNLTNRPFYQQTADDWCLEILRLKWRLNCETIIIDKYGMVHDGQHRLIGLVFAWQEWTKDQDKPLPEQKWSHFWKTEPTIQTLVACGIENDDDTVNTIGTGKPRSLTDVLYRCQWFVGKPASERREMSKLTSFAVKLLWLRTAQDAVSFAPRRPHSESLEFITRHERILECVKFISEEGAGNKLSQLIPLGYASGLLYLMGSATTNPERYDSENSEVALEWKLWDKAQEFWTDLASDGVKTEALREALLNVPHEAGGSYGRDLRCGLVVKAWNLFSDGEKLTPEAIAVEHVENKYGQTELAEMPLLGGIDKGTGKVNE